LDIIDVEKAVEERRVWLQGHLETAADKLRVRAVGRVVNTYDMRSAGTKARDGRTDVWLRVVFEDPDYQPACRWDGNVEANSIQGVPKPHVLRWTDWKNEGDYKRGCRLRGEVMTLARGTTIAADSVLHGDPRLPASWWVDLDQALKTLATHPAPTKDEIDTLGYTTNGVREHFGITLHQASLAEITWTTAHADLHWGNITGPELCILDWESWRPAPAGYDAATLYCNSLLHPPTAQRIRELFRTVLDTHSGHIALLFAICRYLWIVDEGGEYEALGAPLRTLGTEVINSL
jgi:hypothetical protein